MSIITYAKHKTVGSLFGAKFENPVTLMRLILAAVFLGVQWFAYAQFVAALGGFGFINFALSLGIAALVTYKLFTFLKIAKTDLGTESE